MQRVCKGEDWRGVARECKITHPLALDILQREASKRVATR